MFVVIFISSLLSLLTTSIHCLGNITTSQIIIDSNLYSKTEVILQAERFSSSLYIHDEMSLPTELISMFPDDGDFTIEIIQGRTSTKPLNNFYPFSFKRYDLRGLIRDYPSGYIFHSKHFTPFNNNVALFKQYFDLFTYTFKLALTPLIDRSNYITLDNGNVFVIEHKEKVCSEHLNAIKETLSPHKQELFTQYVDYTTFVRSDYKSIKYIVNKYHGFVEFAFEIMYRLNNNYDNTMRYDTYKLNDDLLNTSIEKYNTMLNVHSNRYIEGVYFNFENFVYHHNINLDMKTSTTINTVKPVFEIIELIPSQMLQPLYSTLTMVIHCVNHSQIHLNYETITKYFNVTLRDGEEERYVAVPFSYENRKTTQLNVAYKGGLGLIKRVELMMEMRKTILNFEAMDNDMEFAYLFPCGMIVVDNNYTVTNNIYYNFPNIDVTMPFNLIAITWVVFGFMIVQILNIFLGKRGKSVIDRIKERFMAKWGFLFGK